LPCATLTDVGLADILKLALVVTVRVTVVVALYLPPPVLPVTTMGYVPTAVFDPTVIRMADVPVPGAGMGLGLKFTVVPDGTPEALRVTALLMPPPVKVEVIVDVSELPWVMVREEGEAERLSLTPAEGSKAKSPVVG